MKCNSLSVSAELAKVYSDQATFDIQISAGVAELNCEQWDLRVEKSNPWMKSAHAAYFEAAGFVPYFISIRVEGDCVMQMLCYDTPLHIENVEQNLANRNWFIRRAYKTGLKLLGENRRMLICGHPHLIGDLGFACHVKLSPKEQGDIAALAVKTLLKTKMTSGMAVLKEFTKPGWREVEIKCFKAFETDDNYILPIDPSWASADDYAAVLNSKYRTKRKSDLKKSSSCTTEDWSAEQIEQNASRVTKLYKSVLANANFYLGKIDASHLATMKRENEEAFAFSAIKNETGELVAFYTSWRSESKLDAFLIGMDYEYVGAGGVYNAILHGYVSQAINSRVKELVFGRTGGLAKSSVGAFPQSARCFITHRSRLLRNMFKLVFTYVKPTHYPYRNPWKKEQLDQWKEEGVLSAFDLDTQA